jgi:hypothetical protein
MLIFFLQWRTKRSIGSILMYLQNYIIKSYKWVSNICPYWFFIGILIIWQFAVQNPEQVYISLYIATAQLYNVYNHNFTYYTHQRRDRIQPEFDDLEGNFKSHITLINYAGLVIGNRKPFTIWLYRVLLHKTELRHNVIPHSHPIHSLPSYFTRAKFSNPFVRNY